MKIKSHFIDAPDGSRLRAFDTGGSGPVVVLANGLGGPLSAFDGMIQGLSPDFRVISWDYRGLYGSTLPSSPVDLSVEAHARDIDLILAALGVEACAFLGWSMGVQVGLELYRLRPARITHLVLMNGTFGRPYRGVPLPLGEETIFRLVSQARRLHFLGGPLLGRVRKAGLGPKLLKTFGFIAKSFDDRLFSDMLSEFETLRFDRYIELLSRLSEHDAEALLPTVVVPTLVIAGGRDRITPSYSARRIAERIPVAQYFVLPLATHYAAVEYPKEVLARLRPFLSPTGSEREVSQEPGSGFRPPQSGPPTDPLPSAPQPEARADVSPSGDGLPRHQALAPPL